MVKKLTGPLLGLHFMSHNSVVIDTTHGLILFPHLTMHFKNSSSGTTTKLQSMITEEALTLQPMTTKTITAFVHHPSEWNTTGMETPLEKFTETAILLISHSMSTISDKDKSSQGNQCYGITVSNQKEYTDCRVLHSQSGAIQAH